MYDGETTFGVALDDRLRLRTRKCGLQQAGRSFLLPACSGRIVFEQDAPFGELVADLVGRGEVAPLPRRLAVGDQLLDLLHRHGRLRVLGPPQADDAEHPIELVECVANDRRVRGADLFGVDRGVDVANQIEDRRQTGGGIQVVLERGLERLRARRATSWLDRCG